MRCEDGRELRCGDAQARGNHHGNSRRGSQQRCEKHRVGDPYGDGDSKCDCGDGWLRELRESMVRREGWGLCKWHRSCAGRGGGFGLSGGGDGGRR